MRSNPIKPTSFLKWIQFKFQTRNTYQISTKSFHAVMILLGLHFNTSAQEYPCAGEWNDTLPTGSVLLNCIDEQDVFDNNTIVYLRLNFQFFIGPDCEGPVHWDNPPGVYDLYQWSENFISEANERLANNYQQWGGAMWGGPFPAPHSIPIRYVLSDVILHCVTEEMPPVQQGQNPETAAANWFNYLKATYASNASEEINVFFTQMSAGSGIGSGYFTNISWPNTGLFNHELGHVLGLSHVFEGDDGCTDTPQITWNYDKNCDGDFNDPDDVKNNRGYCWNIKDTNHADCNREPPCTDHPCCSWDYIDSNVMGDNAIASAYSDCQILKMLANINSKKCDHIEALGGLCPPPKAVIEIHPLDNLRETYCSFCLRLEASSNDELYKVDVYEMTSTGQILISSTNWLNGPAQLYCLKTKEEKDGNGVWFGGFKPNTNYRAVLTIENNCGDQESKEITFTSPATNCNIASNNISVAPNPVISNPIINYTIPETSYIHILSAHSIYGLYTPEIEFDRNKAAGTYSLSVNVNSWYSGINYIIIQINDQVYSTALVK